MFILLVAGGSNVRFGSEADVQLGSVCLARKPFSASRLAAVPRLGGFAFSSKTFRNPSEVAVNLDASAAKERKERAILLRVE